MRVTLASGRRVYALRATPHVYAAQVADAMRAQTRGGSASGSSGSGSSGSSGSRMQQLHHQLLSRPIESIMAELDEKRAERERARFIEERERANQVLLWLPV